MEKLIIAILFCLSFAAQAQEAPADEIELEPAASAVTGKAPAAPSRHPASAIVPQRFVDHENNVACYYLASSDSMQLTPTGFPNTFAAINCVKLDDPAEKADREQQRRERLQDRKQREQEEQSQSARESYEQNQKELQQMRSKKSK
jgi:hypothetical protein